MSWGTKNSPWSSELAGVDQVDPPTFAEVGQADPPTFAEWDRKYDLGQPAIPGREKYCVYIDTTKNSALPLLKRILKARGGNIKYIKQIAQETRGRVIVFNIDFSTAKILGRVTGTRYGIYPQILFDY